MSKLKGAVSIILCIVLIVGIAACGGGTTNSPSAPVQPSSAGSPSSPSEPSAAVSGNKSIIIAEQPENGEYDPAGATAYVYFGLQSYCLEGLVDYDPTGTTIPAAALSWETNEDGTEWTFNLNPDGKWSDGSPVTSADFLNTITRALDPETGSWYVDSLFMIKGAEEAFFGEGSIDDIGVELTDDYTIKFYLDSPYANFLDYVILPVYRPSSVKYATKEDEAWDLDPAKNLGNGPFHLSERVPGQSITFIPNEYYSKKENVHYDTVIYKFMNDDQSKTSAYSTGEIDVFPGAPYYVQDQYAGKPDLDKAEVLVTNYILFNINQAPFDDVRVRQAFALAVDRQGICDILGNSKIPSTTFVASGYKSKVDGRRWADVQDTLLEENVEAAKALLAEAGYPDGAGLPPITYTYPSMSYEADVAQALQAQWKTNLGVDVSLNAMEYEVYVNSRRNGELQLSRHQWTGDYNDPATWLDMYRLGNSQNDVEWSNDEYNALMAQSAGELDPQKREDILKAAERILVTDDTVICPLFITESIYLINPAISGYKPATMGGFDFKTGDIDK
ncbi:MAG: peptide ABC transporter substrate-binding protein [Oscillospiraceae bacterium]|nr:peptide ABC transporter substrate-binding protein [Oscillospiraceae bacterium]